MKELFIKTLLTTLPQGLMCKLTGEFVPVFMLHRLINNDGILNTKKIKSLEQNLEYIKKKNYHAISLSGLYDLLERGQPLPPKTVVFTVDDGFADQFEVMAPIFSKYDIPLTCFVITDFIDGKLWPWDDQVKFILNETLKSSFSFNLPNGDIYQSSINVINRKFERRSLVNRLKCIDQTNIYTWLNDLYESAEVEIPKEVPIQFKGGSWQQVSKFVKSGHFVAPHSKTHRIISTLNDEQALDEIIGSYTYLKNRIPSSTNILAYPSGNSRDFSKRDELIVKGSSLRGAVSAIGKTVVPSSSLTRIPRFTLPNKMCDFLQYLSYIEVIKNMFRR